MLSAILLSAFCRSVRHTLLDLLCFQEVRIHHQSINAGWQRW